MPPLKNFVCAGLGYLGLHSQLDLPCYKTRAPNTAIDTTARRSTTASMSANLEQRDDANTTVSYSDPWRPQVHFTPPQNFMNDPNGLFRDEDGLWHLYYQCASFVPAPLFVAPIPSRGTTVYLYRDHVLHASSLSSQQD